MRSILKTGVLMLCLSVVFLFPLTGFSQDSFSQEQADRETKRCADSRDGCLGAAAGFGVGIVGQLKPCKALRECKKECRTEKRDCKKDARSDKKDCKQDCKDRLGSGKAFRDCKKSCREDKRDTKKDCREEKRECKNICRGTFKTPECKRAKKVANSSAVVGVPACAAFVACISQSQKSDTQ